MCCLIELEIGKGDSVNDYRKLKRDEMLYLKTQYVILCHRDTNAFMINTIRRLKADIPNFHLFCKENGKAALKIIAKYLIVITIN